MAYASWSVVFGEQPSAAKWNILGTNDASFNDGTGFGDGIVLPKHLMTGTGSTHAWATWSPTLTNISGGTTNYAKYTQIGKTVFFRFKYTFAGAGISGVPRITLPVTANSDYINVDNFMLTIQLQDFTGFLWVGLGYLVSTSAFDIGYLNASPNHANISSTTPFTWAVSDIIKIAGSYEAA